MVDNQVNIENKNNNVNDKNTKSKSNILSFATTIIIAIILSMFIRTFILEIMIVEGESMLDTIEPGEKVMTLKIAKPNKGDIVLVRESSKNIYLIKRVVATGGETVEITEGSLYVNGEEVKEGFVKEKMNNTDFKKTKLKEDEFFVLGDNRNYSSDSRTYGPYTIEDYEGRVIFGFKIGKKIRIYWNR